MRVLQQMLNAKGYGPLIDDGVFGLQTESAVRIFQEAAGLTVDGIVGPRTTDALTRAQTGDTGQEPAVLQAVRRLGHEVYHDKMNIIGVRGVPGVQNRFDDQLHIIFKDGDNWQHKVYPCTTDPGTYWLENPMHVDGTAKLVPNQYVDAYGWGMHRGKYEALVQIRPVTVARDDGLLDTGLHGINIHSAGEDSQNVNKWSAGCTVVQRLEDYKHMVALCRASGQEMFTYTLILSTDVT